MKYIFGAKPGDHQFLFDYVNQSDDTQEYEFLDEKRFFSSDSVISTMSTLNKSLNQDVRINFLGRYIQNRSQRERKRYFPG